MFRRPNLSLFKLLINSAPSPPSLSRDRASSGSNLDLDRANQSLKRRGRTVNLGSGSFIDATGGEEAHAALVTKLFKACGFAAVGEADGGGRLSMPLDYSLFLIRY